MQYLSTKIHKHKRKDGTCLIFIRIFIEGVKRDVNTGVYVPAYAFDPEKGRVRTNYENSQRLNLLLEQKKKKIVDFFTTYELSGFPITPSIFDEAMSSSFSRTNPFDFFFEEVQRRHDVGITTEGSMKAQVAVFEKLKQFNSRLMWGDFNHETIETFTIFLRKTAGNGVSTVANNLSVLKTYLKIALKKRLLVGDPFEGIQIRTENISPIFLDNDELKKVFSYYYTSSIREYDKRYLRIFLFTCLTGLRIGEVKKLTFQNIKKFGVSKFFLSHKTLKGGSDNSFQLSEMAVELITDEHGKILSKGLIFPDFNGDILNTRIKEIMIDAGIDATKALKISAHKGRHTFATLILQYATLKDVQELIGHRSFRSTEKYIHAVPKNQSTIIQKMTDGLK